MKKCLLLLLSSFCLGHLAVAQLQNIPSITSRIYDTTVSCTGIHALVNTKDFGFTIHPSAPPTWLTTVQLINIGRPYPPVMYQAGTLNVNTQAALLQARSDFYTDLDIQKNGQLTYVRADVPHGTSPLFYAALLYDTASLALRRIDTIPLPDGHDYRVNSRGDVLYAVEYLDTVDISCLSGTAHDTALIQTQRILVKDSNNAVIFSWEPFTSDFSPCEMRYFPGGLFSPTSQTPLDWSHFNSAMWANDSNIIVSFRYTGVFKINVHTGHVAWKLGGLDSTAIFVPDSQMYFSQHDFVQLPDGRYTVYSDGDDTHKHMEGLIYEIDETAKTANLVGRYRAPDTTYSLAMGSYRFYNDDLRFINYGWYASAVLAASPPNLFCDMFDSSGHVIASLVSPFDQIPYRAIPTMWSPDHLRPQIVSSGDTSLMVALPTGSRYYDIKWYDMPDDSSSVLVDSGLVLKAPIAGHTYTADAYIDSNTNLNWRITASPYAFTGPTGLQAINAENMLEVFPNPARGVFHISNPGKQITCSMYNYLGQHLSDLLVKKGDNIFNTPEASGLYIIKPISECTSQTYKLIKE